ncbi:hypothetical protein E2C01_003705 [Portunus trituberculatus]|uniref:Uncharacterized protein n=1 Tax=Portunus trituberculatus TaxID=210409 RepID=A0A5B7CMU0_PORTR|nr:hypothetical protein [Portunus trituberculatus]
MRRIIANQIFGRGERGGRGRQGSTNRHSPIPSPISCPPSPVTHTPPSPVPRPPQAPLTSPATPHDSPMRTPPFPPSPWTGRGRGRGAAKDLTACRERPMGEEKERERGYARPDARDSTEQWFEERHIR